MSTSNIAFGPEQSEQSTLAFQKSLLRGLLQQSHPLSLEQDLEWNSFFRRRDQLLRPSSFSMEIGANFVEGFFLDQPQQRRILQTFGRS
ncbi:hypothetical protein VNO77_19052 [Canavalia gladiata]|uniref:Uncharacterized protein n=1 Tax=Canavalia gladiata TaxID=3824 RepID=A0AAN9LLY6_CANGL